MKDGQQPPKHPARPGPLFAFLLLLALLPARLHAAGEDRTMLLLVGEEEAVVTVASRQPESPAAAPAMVTVVDRKEIEERGYRTLAELLACQPGFYIAGRSRGSTPYLRGLPDSILFLYDGVPLTTDVSKSFAPLDRELSLVGVDRVEIVRGPGSVLWGPDAFAGLVNVVPSRGRQRPGVEASVGFGSNRYSELSASYGRREAGWDAFFAVNAGRDLFHNPEFSGGSAMSGTVDASEQAEAVATFQYGDWLSLSGRWSDFSRRYTMGDSGQSLSWPGEKRMPMRLVKATVSKVLGPSHYSLSGFYQEMEYLVRDTDIERRQENAVSHLEALWDRRLFDRSLLSLGASWRQNRVDGAVVRDGFLPDFLSPGGSLFVPQIDQADFSNRQLSLFAQLRSFLGETEWWIGARLDDHSQYRTSPSYSLGFNRPLNPAFRLKGVYGNAFRSPYSSQLFGNVHFEPESISTAGLELLFNPGPGRELGLNLFHSRLQDHLGEDPYSGLSAPSKREITGLELSGRTPIHPILELSGGLSLIASKGPEESFRSLRYTIIRPGGSEFSVYDEWSEPFDQGPSWLAHLGLAVNLGPGHRLELRGRFGGKIDYSYEKGTVSGSYAQPLLIDCNYRRPGFFAGQDSVNLRISNLLDRDYSQADIFGPTAGAPFTAMLDWRYRF